jgi:hypothetical protein
MCSIHNLIDETLYAQNVFALKEWELEKETKATSEFLLIKSSGIIFIFLPAF